MKISNQPEGFPLKGVYQVEHATKGPKEFMQDWNAFAKKHFNGNPSGTAAEKVMVAHMESLGWTILFTNPVNAIGNC